jgi:hypothetical protein
LVGAAFVLAAMVLGQSKPSDSETEQVISNNASAFNASLNSQDEIATMPFSLRDPNLAGSEIDS